MTGLMRSTLLLQSPRWLIAALVLAIAVPHGGRAETPKKDDQFATSTPFAILIDSDSGTVLFEKNADRPMDPESMAKLMTVELVLGKLKQGEIKPDDEFTISENAWRRGGAPSHTSTMYAAINSRVKVTDLLQGAIIQSGNDACIALAEGIAGNESAFAQQMTDRARELGL
ncbi:MAG TPA: serine hydrolase, partial [Xanthobacteraceae bacterium]|nr:serine hydrolase [Xanthobacteraceae bacterium]